jgi:lipopolysaccharide/colanic/teichoic acid biosynthesis glycosyltransferase
MDVPFTKRIFDIGITLATIWLWLPVLIVCSLLNLIVNGRPVFYVSKRRVSSSQVVAITKFRAMVRHADRVANRNTVPVKDKIFLNIPPASTLYTRLGRIFEHCCLTELPQLWHVLVGHMSLIGNRPLPENIMGQLRSRYPYANDRFFTKSGLTGPVQLVGRDRLSDEDRLRLEIRYCKACAESYSIALDFMILLSTVLIGSRLREPFSVAAVEQIMDKYSGSVSVGWWDAYVAERASQPEPVPIQPRVSRKPDIPVAIAPVPARRPVMGRGREVAVRAGHLELSEQLPVTE